VLSRAADDDLVAVARDVLADGEFGVQLAAQLVEERERDVRAERDGAFVRREASGKELQERRLAGAVAAEDADALAAQDVRREMRDDLPVAVGEAEV